MLRSSPELDGYEKTMIGTEKSGSSSSKTSMGGCTSARTHTRKTGKRTYKKKLKKRVPEKTRC